MPLLLLVLFSVSAHAAKVTELRPLFNSRQPMVQSNMKALEKSFADFLRRPDATNRLSRSSKFLLASDAKREGELGYFGNAPREGLIGQVIDFPIFTHGEKCSVYGRHNNALNTKLQSGQDYVIFAKHMGQTGLGLMLVSPYTQQGVLFVSCRTVKGKESLENLRLALNGLFEIRI